MPVHDVTAPSGAEDMSPARACAMLDQMEERRQRRESSGGEVRAPLHSYFAQFAGTSSVPFQFRALRTRRFAAAERRWPFPAEIVSVSGARHRARAARSVQCPRASSASRNRGGAGISTEPPRKSAHLSVCLPLRERAALRASFAQHRLASSSA